MRSSSTSTYRKLDTCPAAETLLRLTRGARAARVERHVAACDFCGGETQLLARLPAKAAPPTAPPADIPGHLLRLAEELLNPAHAETERAAETVLEAAPLTLTDA